MKRIISILLVLCLVFSLMPAVFAENSGKNENANQNQEGKHEVWTYHPASKTKTVTASEEASTDTVVVTVKATDQDTGEKVPVSGATVGLYVGEDLRSTAQTNSDGEVELTLKGLSYEERNIATVSAYKKVASGRAINGTDRDPLFRYFGTDGNYERYVLELHSETIDQNGNWIGQQIPRSFETNKVDISFLIDATGSMSDEIKNVKDNLAAFAETLIGRGLDIRFSIIEYRDITCGEPTIHHTFDGSHWCSSLDGVTNCLKNIDADGGGDYEETVLDALGIVANNASMQWRSDAQKFAFVLTDADYKINNNYGYTSLEEVANRLKDLGVKTSVITTAGEKTSYQTLYDTTGGVYANIYGEFRSEMLSLADSLVESTIRKVELSLSEPRMLVKMAVCYLANDSVSRSAEYETGVKRMLNEYANRIAETSDGHVLINKFLLFSTENRMDFYDTDELASMADIRIETREQDDGAWWHNVQVHSNAHVTGFYWDGTYFAIGNEHFTGLKDEELLDLQGRESFYRIQLSAIEGAGWDNSMLDDAYAYSTTVAHETGHYLFGFFDEYMDANGVTWNSANRPYPNFGLMDGQHEDIELSKAGIDYSYMDGPIASAAKSLQTYHSYVYHCSCEDSLANLLTKPTNFTEPSYTVTKDMGPYKIQYTKASNNSDRTASYSFADLKDADFLSLPAGAKSGSSFRKGSSFADAAENLTCLYTPVFTASGANLLVDLTAAQAGYTLAGLYYRSDSAAFESADTNEEGQYVVPMAAGSLTELRVFAKKGTNYEYNSYFVEKTKSVSNGYLFSSADNRTKAYVLNSEKVSYQFITDNTTRTNGDYISVNQATVLNCSNSSDMTGGEIYSVACSGAEIDYSTLSWFVLKDGTYKKLKTTTSIDEGLNIGATAALQGNGTYVLMAQRASDETAAAATGLKYTNSETVDGRVSIQFKDSNESSKYYRVYYSEKPITDKTADGVVAKTFSADSTSLPLNLLSRDRTVYAAVEIVTADGRVSPLSKITLVSGEADSDKDGIPDWYCDKYHLWSVDGSEKDIAGSDDDGDGLTNLEEYLGGSDPTNMNDPVHTSNIAVESVSLVSSCKLSVGETKRLTATVLPENATNKDVKWTSDDESVVTVSSTGLLTACNPGTATVTVTTADGGFAATCSVTVRNNLIIVTSVDDLQSAHPYEANCKSVWQYTNLDASSLQVKFSTDTFVEDGADYLTIYTGDGTKVGKYTGSALAGKTVTVNGDTVRILLTSNDTNNAYGFRVTDIEAVRTLSAPSVTLSNDSATGRIKIRWKALEGAVKYKVYRSETASGTFKLIHTTTDLSYLDTVTEIGKAYYYKVRGVDADGTNGRISSTLFRSCHLPAPVVTRSNVASTGKNKLTWSAVKGAVKYKIYRAVSAEGPFSLVKTTTGKTYTDTSAVSCTTYYYKVKAISTNSDTNSGYAYVKLTCDLPRPEITVSNVVSSGKPKVSWKKVSKADGYKVFRATASAGPYSLKGTTTSLSYVDTTAKAGTKYYYRVKAISDKTTANSAYSTYKSALCRLARPVVKISNVASSGKLKLTWKSIDGAVSYKIYRATSKSGPFKLYSTTKKTSFVNTSTTAGKAYYYKVKAVHSKADAISCYSTVVSRVCDLPRPVVTTSHDAATGKNHLEWKRISGAVSYEVYRATKKDGPYTRMYTTTGLTYTNTGAVAGKTYYYKVKALHNKSTADSSYSVVKTLTCDLARPVVSISRKNGKPKLTWKKITGAVKYKIYRSNSKTGSYKLMMTTTSLSYVNTSAKAWYTYYYRVVAVHTNSAANSARSKPVGIMSY